MKKIIALHFLMSWFLLLLTTPAADAGKYKIEHVKGSVYRMMADRHRAVFLVQDEGILVTDPMNKEAAIWLKKKLKKRFDLPVRYVLYSHNHSDHIYGAEVFKNPETTFIAHNLAQQDIILTKADTIIPEITFKQCMRITLGQSKVTLRYHGPNDGRGSVSMLFEPEKVLFIVDWVVVGRMPWKKLWSYDIQGMINSTREILKLDFDVFVGGHAEIGNKADVRRYLSYLEDLYAAVIKGVHAGKSLDQLQKDIRLDEYKDLKHYHDWLPLNVEGVYERLMEESGMGWRPVVN